VRALTTQGVAPGATASLAGAARRLADIDPARGAGGLRFQLELALLAPVASSSPVAQAAPATPSTVPIAQAVVAQPPGPTASDPPAATRRAVTPAPRPDPSPTTVRAVAVPIPSPGEGLGELIRQWPAIVSRLSQNPSLKPLIVVCRPIAVDGNVITLGFPEHQRFYAERIEQRRASIEQGMAEVLGRDIAVKSVATNLELHPVPPDPDSDRLIEEARRIFGEDLVDVGEVS
jgi:hypothetical protein